MKGIIVDKKSESLVLLLSDGTFRNVKKNGDAEIGSVVLFRETAEAAVVRVKRLATAAAALFLVAFLGTGVYAWTTPVQYINIDINPSVELSINRFDRIIKTTPMDEEGKKILESVSVKAQKYENGVSKVIDTAKALGYLEEEGDVLISVSSADDFRREKASTQIKEKVDGNVEVLTFDVESHNLSVKEGISPGKSTIIEKIIENSTDLTREELTNFSVKELLEKAKENRSNEREQEKGSKGQEKESNQQKPKRQGENLKQQESREQKEEPKQQESGTQEKDSGQQESGPREKESVQQESKEQDKVYWEQTEEENKPIQTIETGAAGSDYEKARNDKGKNTGPAGNKDSEADVNKGQKNRNEEDNKRK